MRIGGNRTWLLLGTALPLMAAAPALAQEAPVPPGGSPGQNDTAADTADTTAIIVTGQRNALKRAADIKRNADTVVDSITATDIGAFPDKSIAEALQRVPGVTVTRSAFKDDVMHYGAEPSGIIIRGLQQVRSEFNGRDTFSATSSEGLSWADISPELMAGVDVYKNQTAEMIEGGIAGTVNLRTRLPFDQAGQVVAGGVTMNYGDISQRGTPDASLLYSNRWQTGIGEFGLLANGAYSQVITTSRGATVPRMMPFAPGTYAADMTYIPSGAAYSETEYNRKRRGVSLAGQWKSNDGRLTATAQYNYSRYNTTWFENQLLSYWAWVDPATTTHSTVWTDPSILQPPDAPGLGINEAGGGTPFTFGPDGLFQTGTITGSRGDWGYGLIDWDTGLYVPGSTDQYGVLPNGLPLFEPCLKTELTHANQPCRAGAPVNTATRYSTERRTIEDAAFNLVWQATDRLKMRVDAQHVRAKNYNYDITFNFRVYADIGLDLTGKYPKMTLLSPSGYNQIGSQPFADPRNYQPESVMDHITDSTGTENAFRYDASYEVGSPWLSEVLAGARFADRHQEHRWSLYNWASITSDWGVNPADSAFLTSGRTYNDDGSVRFEGYEPGFWETIPYGQEMLGGGLVGTSPLVFMTRNAIQDRDLLWRNFSVHGQTDEGGIASSTWNPICDRPDELENSCFTPGEVLDVREKTKSAYAMVKFGGDEARLGGGLRLSGNIGVRWVQLEIASKGALNYAVPFTDADLNCQPLPPEVIDALEPGQYAISPGCLAAGSTEDQAFSSGGSTPSTVRTKHDYWLPSFNARLDLGNNFYLRFAASRAISKPDIGLLKNYVTIQRSFVEQSAINEDNLNIILDAEGNPVGYRYGYTGATGNPRLKPIQADQLDLALESYSGDVGSFSVTGFYKKFHDYIQNGTFVVPITNEGVTRDVVVTGPVNGSGASIYGVEFAFQRYFDFLPAPLDGFGVQANYTYIKNEGVKNANLVVDTTGGSNTARSSQSGMINPGRLENLSDHSFNLILMYEKSRFGARLAYNWRSRYLNSVNDCCLGFPVWNKAEGFLDGSLRWAVTPNFEFNFQASNLLNTRSHMLAQVSGPTDLDPNAPVKFLPGGSFEYDRRYQLGVRVKF